MKTFNDTYTDSSEYSSIHSFILSETSCCEGIRGNVNGDALDETDISDLVFLVAYMFQDGNPPLCLDEANIDGSVTDPVIDISDLVALVAYMFQGGPAPANCP